jgi:hypothetical protein
MEVTGMFRIREWMFTCVQERGVGAASDAYCLGDFRVGIRIGFVAVDKRKSSLSTST